MFKFIRWNDNSCRYDAVLSLLTFIHNSDSEIETLFQNTNQLQFISEAIFNINSHNFAPGQKKFISTLKKMNIVSTSNFSDIEPLMHSIMNLPKFNFQFMDSKKCHNKDCPYAYESKNTIQTSPLQYDFEDERYISTNLLENIFNTYLVLYSYEQICSCNNELQKYPDNPHICTVYHELIQIPEYCFITLQQLYGQEFADPSEEEKENARGEEITNNKQHNLRTNSNQNSKSSRLKGLQKVNKLFHEGHGLQIRSDILEKISIPLNYFKDIDGIKYKFILQSIIFFERNNHFTLLFQSPRFNGKTHSGWIYCDSLNVMTVRWDEFHLNLIILIEGNKFPLIQQ